jgi:mRNA-degrading endonuclease toxin of MazEF toxin-antitoxin module
LDHFPVEAIRVVEMPEYETRVGRVSPEQLEAVRASLLTTGELLTADPARIEVAAVS